MKTKETVRKIRIASVFSQASKKRPKSIVIAALIVILSISIVFPFGVRTVVRGSIAFSVVRTPTVIPPSCNGHAVIPSDKICYPIFSPRLNVPISYSGVTEEASQPRPVS